MWPGRLAPALGDALVAPVGAVAALLWWFSGRGVAQRAGWVRPDPTLYRDGLQSWVLLAVVVTAVDLVLVLVVHLLAGRLARSRAAHAAGVAVHLLAAVALAAAYLGW